mgnify:CR=1 FL=1
MLGAFLHDVGKIGIPDQILLKPGRLTSEEFQVMQTHAVLGIEIVAGGAERSEFRRHGRLYLQCCACRHQCSLISGTIFESSKLPLSH